MGDVKIEVLDGGLGLIPASGDDYHAVIGTCASGDDYSIVATRDPSTLVAARGDGASVEASAFAMKANAQVTLHVKAPTAVQGKIAGSGGTPAAIATSTNANPSVVTTAAPHGLATGAVVLIAGHLTNVAINGTFPVKVLSPTTFSVPIAGTGAGTGGTFVPTGVTMKALGTSKPTITGTPVDTMRIRFRWVKGGQIGTSGATFQWSADGGATYSTETPIGTANTYTLPRTGVTLTFGVGSVIAGDEYRFNTTEPLPDDAGVMACIRKLGLVTQKFRLIHLVGDLHASSAVSFDPELEALANDYTYVGLLGHARDFVAADNDENGWIDSLAADFASFASSRVSVTAGHYRVTSPISGRKYRRPLSFVAAARLMGRPIQEHAGKVRTGALKGMDQPTPEDIKALDLDPLIYHDSKVNTGLRDARFFTARTRKGRPGYFVDEPRMMCQPSSDYQIWPYRSVIDKICGITYEVFVDELNDDPELDPKTGTLLPKEARGIESRASRAYEREILAKRAASSVTCKVSTDINMTDTPKIAGKVRAVPKGYAKEIEVDIGYTNPALEQA